ncbi:uncharacterized protein K460DRAFT_192717 [Cucurbitaria berberidis CBS 394.84]|uniref:Uncharacterized protein n=1 Tax=Cucurbitaria berberidis CBS 394.84 TaxID=1168544 RepID=A0A9P4G845_9PLEO|nr:uncharacterized protein K460DRAFT_192717 [Cucurbitaria berberidis CBS 394.84]KAF1840813.1 hypothetical protein K460DRAFT_192717 [Cucurbitaria berberidis CBS 394.84]
MISPLPFSVVYCLLLFMHGVSGWLDNQASYHFGFYLWFLSFGFGLATRFGLLLNSISIGIGTSRSKSVCLIPLLVSSYQFINIIGYRIEPLTCPFSLLWNYA